MKKAIFVAAALLFLAHPLLGANLVPALDDAAWETWSFSPSLEPESGAVERGGRTCLWMHSPNRFATMGRWTADGGPVTAGNWYNFRASYCRENVASDRTSIVALLTWLGTGPQNEQVKRQYIEDLVEEEGEWRSLVGHVQAPAGANALRVELFLRWTEHGSVWWRDVELHAAPAAANRVVRVAAVYQHCIYGSSTQELLDQTGAAIDEAAVEGPDLIVLTENFTDRGRGRPVSEAAEVIPLGPGSQLLSAKAAEHNCYISASLHEAEDGLYYNCGVLFDREGELVGKYRKAQIALEEVEIGVTPGRDFPVFDTDFGRVGLLICWDNSFAETARILALRGAEMILLSIAGDGVKTGDESQTHWELVSRLRAMENGVYFVGALGLRGPSWIVSPDGTILAQAGSGSTDGIAIADCDLDYRPYTLYLSVGDTYGDHRSVYLMERRPDLYGPLVDSETKVLPEGSLPVAVPEAAPETGVAPFSAHLHGSGSYDPQGWELVAWEWSLDGTTLSSLPEFDHEFDAPGAYEVFLRVQNENGVWSAPTPVSVSASPPPVSVVSLAPDKAGPHFLLNNPVTWTLSTTGGESLQFRFWLRKDGGAWSVPRDWAASASWPWSPVAPGIYDVSAQVREEGHAGADGEATCKGYNVAGIGPVAVVDLTPTRPTPHVREDNPVTWILRTSGGVNLRYRFWFRKDAGIWICARNWDPSFYWNWSPEEDGGYDISADVREAGEDKPAGQKSYPLYLVGPITPIVVVGLSPNKPSPHSRAANPVTWTLSATGGYVREYRYYLRKNGGAWTRVRNWTSNPSWSWSPTENGAYDISAQVREAGHSSPDGEATVNNYVVSD
ncbi:MAG: nitrilase-related carbon-nitrogen hydrolase [Planctomycetota bacterium]